MNARLVSYAASFVSYLLDDLKSEELSRINQIILFGSAARGEAEKTSDVDVFIDCGDPAIEPKINGTLDAFRKSAVQRELWDLLGIRNNIHVIIGVLGEWKELKPSIEANGIVLYGRYKELPEGKLPAVLFSWENVKPESRRAALNKKLFGYSVKGRKVGGFLGGAKGERIGKGTIIVPSERSGEFVQLFKKMRIPFAIVRVVE